MDRISLVSVKAVGGNPNAVLIEHGLSYLAARASALAKRAKSATSIILRKWNEQAVRAAEIERMQAMDRARMGERLWWAEGRWYL